MLYLHAVRIVFLIIFTQFQPSFNPKLPIYDIDLLANVVRFFVECLPEDGRRKPKH